MIRPTKKSMPAGKIPDMMAVVVPIDGTPTLFLSCLAGTPTTSEKSRSRSLTRLH